MFGNSPFIIIFIIAGVLTVGILIFALVMIFNPKANAKLMKKSLEETKEMMDEFDETSGFSNGQYSDMIVEQKTTNSEKQSDTKFCSYCGEKLDKDAKFCKNCGAKIE